MTDPEPAAQPQSWRLWGAEYHPAERTHVVRLVSPDGASFYVREPDVIRAFELAGLLPPRPEATT